MPDQHLASFASPDTRALRASVSFRRTHGIRTQSRNTMMTIRQASHGAGGLQKPSKKSAGVRRRQQSLQVNPAGRAHRCRWCRRRRLRKGQRPPETVRTPVAAGVRFCGDGASKPDPSLSFPAPLVWGIGAATHDQDASRHGWRCFYSRISAYRLRPFCGYKQRHSHKA